MQETESEKENSHSAQRAAQEPCGFHSYCMDALNEYFP